MTQQHFSVNFKDHFKKLMDQHANRKVNIHRRQLARQTELNLTAHKSPFLRGNTKIAVTPNQYGVRQFNLVPGHRWN
jgi:hypothetical protein